MTSPTRSGPVGDMDPVVRAVGVVRIYPAPGGPVHALKEVDLTVGPGTTTAIVGPSGSGKSTLMRLIAALDRPTAGEIEVAGLRLRDASRASFRRLRRLRIAYVFQRPAANLLADVTAAGHLIHASRVAGRRRIDIAGLLRDAELGHRADHLPGELSGGEQQRLAVAAALATSKPLVVADEPTAELDGDSAHAMLRLLRHVADAGAAVVVATHDPVVVDALERTLALRDGSLESETGSRGRQAVIDRSGRIQLPPTARALFPDDRALLRIEDGGVRLTPP